MKVKKILPRGFCHGVVNAMHLVAKTLNDPSTKKPIYILGQIVHNKNITKAFTEAGAITLEGKNRREILDQVDSGTVIITAHGIDHNLIVEAKNRGLDVVDATCSDVYKTHNIIKEKLKDNYQVLYIGKKSHPEPEGVIAINPEKIHLIESIEDLKVLSFDENTKLCITNQTTMSLWDVNHIIKQAQLQFPQIEVINEICLATQERQEAIVREAKDVDLCLIVGDPLSNNSNKLREVCETKANTKAYLIGNVNDIDINWLLDENVNIVGVSSGASTPSIFTNQVIQYIEQFDKNNQETYKKPELPPLSKLIPRTKK